MFDVLFEDLPVSLLLYLGACNPVLFVLKLVGRFLVSEEPIVDLDLLVELCKSMVEVRVLGLLFALLNGHTHVGGQLIELVVLDEIVGIIFVVDITHHEL